MNLAAQLAPQRSPAPSASADLRTPPERPWVESAELDAYLDAVDADEDARAFCHDLATDGVATIDLGDEGLALCDQAAAETDRFFARGDVERVQDAWLSCRAVRALATLPLILDRLSLAYGRRAIPFQTLSFLRGTQQPLHSDAIHFHSLPERFMCGVWIALEDITPQSGPLAYVAGSHRLPVLTMQGAGVNHPQPVVADYDRYYSPALHARLEASRLPRLTAAPRKGQALVWAANLVHGGSPITDPDATRRSLVVHHYFEDCLYYTPMTSDPAADRFRTRLPWNISTGGWNWPTRDGRKVAVPRGALIEACFRRVLRRPFVKYLPSVPARSTS